MANQARFSAQARMTFEQAGHLRLNDIPQQSSAVSLVRTLPPAVTETGRDRIRLVDDHLGYECPP